MPWKRHIAKRAVKAYRKRWRCEDAMRATKQDIGLETFLVRSMLRIERIVLIALLVMRFVAERLRREPAWTKRLIPRLRDERFPKPIKVYLFPPRRDWGRSDGGPHLHTSWFGSRHCAGRTGGAMN